MLRKLRASMERRDEGFTLIELLVVVIIIGILAAVAIPVFLNQRERAWNSAVEADLRNAGVQVESYYAENGEYPATGTDLSTIDVQTSNDVTLVYSTADVNTEFCITGAHSSLESGAVTGIYDSDGGGVDMSATAC